ncbi:alpha/beta fold hydrolase [Leucobacter coleopterorum]|uniref:alpha/beta fold hydrolase n=1 Tax=Leucobacter coleopterorum TaxID=2714933 RepID=UPI001FCC1F76|nr:alpha/beta hydrolase [Leucobacter coleopterorum]
MSNEATGSTTTAEFRFLEGDAVRVGRTTPLPTVERVWTEVGNAQRVSALRFEPQHPPQLVTLHGVGLNAHSFDPMLLALDVPAISIDLPGHGRSDWRSDADYRPDHLAVDVITALEALCPQPVTLLGHSLGGLTAALVAASLTDLVSQLIVVDITPGISPSRDASSVTEFIVGQRDYGSVEEIVDRAIQFGIGSNRAALTRGVTLNTRLRADGRLEWTHHFAHLDGPLPAAADDDPQPYAPSGPRFRRSRFQCHWCGRDPVS